MYFHRMEVATLVKLLDAGRSMIRRRKVGVDVAGTESRKRTLRQRWNLVRPLIVKQSLLEGVWCFRWLSSVLLHVFHAILCSSRRGFERS